MSQRKASATGAAKPPRKKIRWKRILPFYLMALPGFIYMIINNYLPMFGIVIAFKKLNFKKGIWGSPWCGFDNFKFLFASADAWASAPAAAPIPLPIDRIRLVAPIMVPNPASSIPIPFPICKNPRMTPRAGMIQPQIMRAIRA